MSKLLEIINELKIKIMNFFNKLKAAFNKSKVEDTKAPPTKYIEFTTNKPKHKPAHKIQPTKIYNYVPEIKFKPRRGL